jgi:ribonuclease Z
MTQHLIEAYRVDVETRTNADGNQREFPEGHRVNAHEVSAGVVYKDSNVTVTAFPTKHAMDSYGYRFDTPDRSIVISGDTNPTQATVEACRGCDVLIHEVHTPAWLATRPDTFRRFAAKYHTSTPELADLAPRPSQGSSCSITTTACLPKSCSPTCRVATQAISSSVAISTSTERPTMRCSGRGRRRAMGLCC